MKDHTHAVLEVQSHISNALKILAMNIVNGSPLFLKKSPYANLQAPAKKLNGMLFARK